MKGYFQYRIDEVEWDDAFLQFYESSLVSCSGLAGALYRVWLANEYASYHILSYLIEFEKKKKEIKLVAAAMLARKELRQEVLLYCPSLLRHF